MISALASCFLVAFWLTAAFASNAPFKSGEIVPIGGTVLCDEAEDIHEFLSMETYGEALAILEVLKNTPSPNGGPVCAVLPRGAGLMMELVGTDSKMDNVPVYDGSRRTFYIIHVRYGGANGTIDGYIIADWPIDPPGEPA